MYTYMDLQIHTTMHEPYPFFSKGLEYFDSLHPPKLSYKHQLTNVNYANFLEHNAGARIIINGAITTEWIPSQKKARKSILEQIEYVNRFAEAHADKFVVARTPQEVRDYFFHTDKTIIVHSIEGGKELINSQEDADFWASQGVAFITLLHLVDSEYGSAAVLPMVPTRVVNLDAAVLHNSNKGLTEKGKQAILWLANAGILTDVTHMSDQTRKDALQLMEQYEIPPLSTHDGFKPLQNHARALDEEDVLNVYRNRGLMSLPISGMSLIPYRPQERYQQAIDSLELYCEGSVDSYKFTYLTLKAYIESNLDKITGGKHISVNELSEEEKIDLSIGFQSDFNGWLDHSRPRYGEEGCRDTLPGQIYEPIELDGMPHPGYLASQWRLLEKEGVDLRPVQRASEKFLRLWEYMLEHKGRFSSVTTP